MSDGTSIVLSVLVSFPELGLTVGPFDTPDPSQRYEFPFELADRVRLVRLDVGTSAGGNTGAREIELYAD